MSAAASLQDAWARADAAKVREIACHRRAIVLQDDAVVRFDLLGHLSYAAAARERALLAREALHMAQDEEAETKARRAHFVALTRLGSHSGAPWGP